ncbi:putative protein kinase CAMK-CAMKL-CHK1 family [Helianthus anomalus]
MKLVRHPNVVRLHEVLASRTKIYIILEFITGDELFEKVPENLLLDSQGNLKISDFGLSALPTEGVSILRTTCGTPNYVAPDVIRTEW